MPVNPALVKLRQKDCHRFEASLGYIARSYPSKLERKKELKIVEVNARYNLDAGLKNGKQNYHVLSHGVKV